MHGNKIHVIANLSQACTNRFVTFLTTIDNLDTEVENLKIDLQVNEKARSFLPPQIQSFCERHQIESHLDITARARFNLLDIDHSDVTAHLQFGPSHVAVGDKVLDIESATSDLVYKDSRLSIAPMKISTLGGTITGSTTIMAAESRPIPAAGDAPLTTMNTEDAENLAKVVNLVPETTAAKIGEVASSLDFNLQLDIDKLKMQEIHRLQEISDASAAREQMSLLPELFGKKK